MLHEVAIFPHPDRKDCVSNNGNHACHPLSAYHIGNRLTTTNTGKTFPKRDVRLSVIEEWVERIHSPACNVSIANGTHPT